MSARHGQGFTTWLIMLPLLVVPLIAVFGVPQFAPITARTADGASGDEPVLELGSSSDAPLAESVPPFPGGTLEHAPPHSSPPNTEGWSDPFDNPSTLMDAPPSGELTLGDRSADAPEKGLGDPFSPSPDSAETTPPAEPWATPDARVPDFAPQVAPYSRRSPLGENPRNNSAPQADPNLQLTWRQAVARLNELGVQKFQLSQTEEPYVFQFVCALSRRDNPRVTHHFEAKAGEPLKAVENVIQQVESWSAQQATR